MLAREQSLLAVLVLLGACGGDKSPTDVASAPKAQPGVRAVAGAAIDDTVLAQPLQALIVEVRGADGAVVHGATVRFDARPPADTSRRAERAVYVCALATPQCGPAVLPNSQGNDSQFASDTTDATGRAKALVRLGTVAGPARVAVSVPELGLHDSVSFTVRPGGASTVRFTVRDTMVYAGASVALRPSVRDRFGNPRGDPVAVTTDASGVADVDAQGVLTARQAGRARVLAQAGAFRDSAFVSVVPSGRLVAWLPYDGTGGSIVLVDIDGSNLKRITPNPNADGAFPVWAPRSSKILFHTGALVVDVVDSSGAQRKTVGAPGSSFGQFTPDESGILFVTLTSSGGLAWRANADGSQPSQLATLNGLAPYPYGAASFSPAGDRVAYSNGFPTYAITVVDLTTGRVERNLPFGVAPRWSPGGDRIAFTTVFDGPVGVINADGTGRRILTTDLYSPGVAWSPDGQWLIARRSSPAIGLTLIRVSDGLTIPLRFSADLYQPSWR